MRLPDLKILVPNNAVAMLLQHLGKRQNSTTNKQVLVLLWNSISEYLKAVTKLTSRQGDKYISLDTMCFSHFTVARLVEIL